MSQFHLKIISCDRVFYDGECESFVFPGYGGEMAILAHHEPMTTAIYVGEIRFRKPGETEWERAIVSDGLLKVDRNKVTVLIYSAERPEEIDALRAKEAMERAQEQLQHKQSLKEYHISQASLARAMARLRGANRYQNLDLG